MDEKYEQKHEVTGVLLFAVAVLLGLSYYLPLSLTGSLGRFLRGIGTGLIGVAAYAIPLILIYAAVDYFIEKRPGVAPLRVRSVLMLLISIAAILAVCTVSPTYVKAASSNLPDGDAKASKAIVLLWKMGMEPERLGAPEGDIVLSGGVLGGSIALALRALAAKLGALLILIAFTISQIVLIFNISLSDTAAKTAKVIRTTSQKATEVLRTDKAMRERERAARLQAQRNQQINGAIQSYIKNPAVSPFEEVPGPQGFIDLEGTPVKMNQETWAEREKVFDFDLTNDTDPAPEAQKVPVPKEPRVDFGFSNPKAPVKKEEVDPNGGFEYLPPLENETPRPGTVLPAPSVSPNQDYVEYRHHESGGTKIRVPDLNGMEQVPTPPSVQVPQDLPDMPPVVKPAVPQNTMPAPTSSDEPAEPVPSVSQVENNREFVEPAGRSCAPCEPQICEGTDKSSFS